MLPILILVLTLCRTSVEKQLEFLKISFSLFEKPSNSAIQLNCVQRFLVPMLYFADVDSLQSFFVSKLEPILEMMKASISACQTAEIV